ncbi:hypothetical protein [Kitasatospora sp. NPDC005856]|uniref:hypothetical protein n=1 Tax=Kitasatospora sp. NPDC005856 TaxID=3154566 RepID=UPI0033E1B261
MAGNSMLNDPLVVQQVLITVATQDTHMQHTQRQIQNIVEQVQTYFRAEASAVFCQKMQDWQARYAQVREQYTRFHDLLVGGSGLIQDSGQQSVRVVSSLGAGDAVLRELG